MCEIATFSTVFSSSPPSDTVSVAAARCKKDSDVDMEMHDAKAVQC